MQAMVYEKSCIRCGLCTSLCPGIFSMAPGETARARTGDIPRPLQIGTQAAAESCPVSAIEIR